MEAESVRQRFVDRAARYLRGSGTRDGRSRRMSRRPAVFACCKHPSGKKSSLDTVKYPGQRAKTRLFFMHAEVKSALSVRRLKSTVHAFWNFFVFCLIGRAEVFGFRTTSRFYIQSRNRHDKSEVKHVAVIVD